MDAILKVHPKPKPILSGCVPGASFEKLNTNVSQPLATVVTCWVSHVWAGSLESSTFKRIGTPACGDQKITDIVEFVNVRGISVANPAGVPRVVPAQVGDPAVLSTINTILEAFIGSAVKDAVVPPNGVTV